MYTRRLLGAASGIKRCLKYPSIALSAVGILVAVLFSMASLELSIEATASDRRKQGSRWSPTLDPIQISPYRSLRPSLPPFGMLSSYDDNDIKQHYDWTVSTENNFRSDNTEFHGAFRSIRQRLDLSYHANYSPDRQLIQDSIIESMLLPTRVKDADTGTECRVPTEPWIVFTAGVYGAGKTHTINKLHKSGQFSLESFVTVDPDEMRRRLPEFLTYSQQNPEKAGELTRKEAGMMAEILTNSALEQGMNVLVDGSLKDAAWHETYFTSLRQSYPRLRIGIIHVTAPKEAIFDRVQQRAKTTGRLVPMDALRRSIDEVPKAVKRLQGYVDFFVEVDNPPEADDTSFLESSRLTSADIRNTFRQKCEAT